VDGRGPLLLPGGVSENYDARAEPGRVPESQMGGLIDSVEEPLTAPRSDGENPEVELVDEIVLHERAVEFAGAILQDIPACLLLQAGYLPRDIGTQERRVPLDLLQSRRGHVLGKSVDPIGESSPGRGGQASANTSYVLRPSKRASAAKSRS
jgi:hypothetical protein